ncbi:MAG: dihydropteroate synthase [Candidatus Marinimicrobia bacterium]|nr:dihydropteroate synthase [Candidatus Neomarinimicrobiota bacterium]|tara:strand:- start:1277 stop:2128 length:852 start_codon:yes stop_codon:yes gene_type:complete
MNIEHLNDWLLSKKKQSLIMGILNITPDSFSDGGDFFEKNIAIDRALEMVEQGADIIDIGGESTRPFSDSVSLKEEISRVIPVIEGICKESDVCISIDTTKSKVASEALEAGASVINDISAMEIDSLMVDVALKFNCPIVLMHMKGIPKNMQDNPQYQSLISDIKEYLLARIDFVVSKGIDRNKIIIDPGIGFGKTVENNFEIINNLDQFVKMNFPVLLGASRKSFIGVSLNLPENDRLEGSIAANIIGLQKGAKIFRVHDVVETNRAMVIANKIFNSNNIIS